MGTKANKKEVNFERDYNKIVNNQNPIPSLISQSQQWSNPNDYIEKFSLIKESPNSITSTNTFSF